jgi:hypothetical protein
MNPRRSSFIMMSSFTGSTFGLPFLGSLVRDLTSVEDSLFLEGACSKLPIEVTFYLSSAAFLAVSGGLSTMLEWEGLACAAGVVVRLRLVGAQPIFDRCNNYSGW